MSPKRRKVTNRHVRSEIDHTVGQPSSAGETGGTCPPAAGRQGHGKSAEQTRPRRPVHPVFRHEAGDDACDLRRLTVVRLAGWNPRTTGGVSRIPRAQAAHSRQMPFFSSASWLR